MNASSQSPDVLCLLGTDHHPYVRALDWMDTWNRSNPSMTVLVQHGFTPGRRDSSLMQTEFVGYDDLSQLLRRVRAVVCHGGPGTIFDCRKAGLVPVVMPRSAAGGEHVDDHQMLFTQRLASAGLIDRVESYDELETALDDAVRRGRQTLEQIDDEAVTAATGRLAGLVETELAQRSRRRARRPVLRRALHKPAHPRGT